MLSENMQQIFRRTPVPKCDFNTCFSCCFSKDQFQPDWNLQHFNIVSIYVNTCYTKIRKIIVSIYLKAVVSTFSQNYGYSERLPKFPGKKLHSFFPENSGKPFRANLLKSHFDMGVLL